ISSTGAGKRTLMELTHQVWAMDSDLDGSLYVDQWDRPREVIRFALTGGDPERLASSRVDYTREYSTVLADGRVLFETQFSGRSRLAVVRPGERVFPLVETSDETFAVAAVI